MSDPNVKLDRFTAAIVAEANADTQRTLASLSEKRATLYAAAEDQVLNEVYHHIHGEVARIKSEAGRQASRHMLENKRTLYLRREEISHEVFEAVRARVDAYTSSPAYGPKMAAMLADALSTLGGPKEARVLLRPADRYLAELLAQSQSGVSLTFLEGEFALGGLVVDAPTLGKRADASFDSTMEQLSGSFAELFGLSLPTDLGEGGMTHA